MRQNQLHFSLDSSTSQNPACDRSTPNLIRDQPAYCITPPPSGLHPQSGTAHLRPLDVRSIEPPPRSKARGGREHLPSQPTSARAGCVCCPILATFLQPTSKPRTSKPPVNHGDQEDTTQHPAASAHFLILFVPSTLPFSPLGFFYSLR